jgi:hypothetical protein
LALALVAGKKRVPRPAMGKTALVTVFMGFLLVFYQINSAASRSLVAVTGKLPHRIQNARVKQRRITGVAGHQ